MLTPPRDFVEKLTRTFDNELRVRWSLKAHRFLIEQKVGRGALLPIRVDAGNDDMIRARDGYALVMSVAPGSTTECGICGEDLKLAIRETSEITCARCKSVGRRSGVTGGFFPLDDLLIEHLKMMDPTRVDQLRRVRDESARQEWLKSSEEAALHREAAMQYKDALLEQMPKAGFPSLTPHGWHH